MKDTNRYIERVKTLSLGEPDVIHSFLDEVFSFLNAATIEEDDLFAFVHDIRVVFFQYMNETEKLKLCSVIVKYLSSMGNLYPQIIEFAGVIYKYIPVYERDTLLKAVLSFAHKIYDNPRGVVALTTFIKYTSKTYSEVQRRQAVEIVHGLLNECDEELKDTIVYTLDNIKSEFIPRKADVLLLIPELLSGSSFLQPPLCFMRAASQLIDMGMSVDIFDNRIYNYGLDSLVKIIGSNYKYIVITSTPLDQVQTYFVDHRFIIFSKTVNAVQKKCEYKKIIVAGAHGTVDVDMLLEDVQPDVIVRGEFDEKLASVIHNCETNTLELAPRGVMYRQEDRWLCSAGVIEKSDWDKRPIDFSLIELKYYFGYKYIKNTHVKQINWAVLQTSRGCPYECTFCFNLYGRQVRHKHVGALIQEIKQLQLQDCREIFFIDQTFTVDKDYVRCLCDEIKKAKIQIPWQCETRVDLIDEDTLLRMRVAGCKAVWLGIESFDEEVLRKCKKNYNLNQLKDAFKILDRVGMEYRAFIMVGMEGETQDSIDRTVTIIERERIKLSKSIIQCTPRPGTVYYSHLPSELRNQIKHFWQLDALRGYSECGLSSDIINQMVQRLLLIANGGQYDNL